MIASRGGGALLLLVVFGALKCGGMSRISERGRGGQMGCADGERTDQDTDRCEGKGDARVEVWLGWRLRGESQR